MNERDKFARLLRRLNACQEGTAWCEGKTLTEFWNSSDRADWMLWLCGKMAGMKDWPNQNSLVRVTCLCVERSLPLFESQYPADRRPRKAIETARAWAKGNSSTIEVKAAANATEEAAYATNDADAPYYNNHAATYTAFACVYVAYSACRSANASSYAVANAAAAASFTVVNKLEGRAIRYAELKEMARIVRANLKIPKVLNLPWPPKMLNAKIRP